MNGFVWLREFFGVEGKWCFGMNEVFPPDPELCRPFMSIDDGTVLEGWLRGDIRIFWARVS